MTSNPQSPAMAGWGGNISTAEMEGMKISSRAVQSCSSSHPNHSATLQDSLYKETWSISAENLSVAHHHMQE